LQNPSQINRDNQNNVRCDNSITFREERMRYLKEIINELETNSKKKNIRELHRGMNRFKKGYQHIINFVKDENCNLFEDYQNILNRWKNFSCQLLNVDVFKDFRQTEVHTAESLISEPISIKAEIVIIKLKRCKSPGINQDVAELIQAGGNTLCSEIHRLN
jgi:hypothetical protein